MKELLDFGKTVALARTHILLYNNIIFIQQVTLQQRQSKLI